MIIQSRISTKEEWIVHVKCGTHNHELTNTLEDHPYLCCLSEEEREFVNDMTKYHMALIFI